MKIKIISDGTSMGTHIIDENNREIDNIIYAQWEIDASKDGRATVYLKLINVPVEVHGELIDNNGKVNDL